MFSRNLFPIAILVLFVFAILTSLNAPNVEGKLLTPLLGVVEWIMICIFLGWGAGYYTLQGSGRVSTISSERER